MTKQKLHPGVLVTAILGIVALEGLAIVYGIDGKFFAIAVGAIGGIVGWTMPQLRVK
jgi:hypothetical protein